MNDKLVRAAQYVRMSTEHQQYSTENQSDVLKEYANKRGIEIVRTFTDAGKRVIRQIVRWTDRPTACYEPPGMAVTAIPT